MMNRFWAVFKARNLEFFRDKGSLGWAIVFPMLILVGFAFIFDSDGRALYKVGVLAGEQTSVDNPMADVQYVEFVTYQDEQKAKHKIQRHALDLLIDPQSQRYWVNVTSPKGYVTEQLLLAQTRNYQKLTLEGREIRYLDWVLPGILGMNIMFSSLFGVGYVIVRYRKNSVLKRLKATPLSAFEFLSAQILSRLFIVMTITTVIFIVCDWMFDFYMAGSYFTLFLVALLGATNLIALGLLIACRSSSEELIGGLLNLFSWPMMILSGVWFSLEGAPDFMRNAAQILPLTHVVDAARKVMTQGAGVMELGYHLGTLLVMTLVFLGVGAALFRWHQE